MWILGIVTSAGLEQINKVTHIIVLAEGDSIVMLCVIAKD